MWNVWFGIKEGSEHFDCILYLSSFSSEYTWVLLNGPNGHWVTPGQPSNTLFKSQNTQAQDFWTTRARLTSFFFGGGGPTSHWVWSSPKTHLRVHKKRLGDPYHWRLHNWVQKEPKCFVWPNKKINKRYFFKGQTKYFCSFWTQFWSLQWYGSPKRVFWTLRWVLGYLKTQCVQMTQWNH